MYYYYMRNSFAFNKNVLLNYNESFDEQKYTLGIFIDLSKAFDTVNHQLLLAKLPSEYKVFMLTGIGTITLHHITATKN